MIKYLTVAIACILLSGCVVYPRNGNAGYFHRYQEYQFDTRLQNQQQWHDDFQQQHNRTHYGF